MDKWKNAAMVFAYICLSLLLAPASALELPSIGSSDQRMYSSTRPPRPPVREGGRVERW